MTDFVRIIGGLLILAGLGLAFVAIQSMSDLGGIGVIGLGYAAAVALPGVLLFVFARMADDMRAIRKALEAGPAASVAPVHTGAVPDRAQRGETSAPAAPVPTGAPAVDAIVDLANAINSIPEGETRNWNGIWIARDDDGFLVGPGDDQTRAATALDAARDAMRRHGGA